MKKIKHILKSWLVLALIATMFCGLAYVTVQQALRQGANDPQIQMAEDIAGQMEAGASAASVLPSSSVDLSRSLAPFVILFNGQGTQSASSAVLHGQSPQLPGGVLDYVRQHGEDRLTWQPEPGVRIAAVVTSYSGAEPGFVLAGRSLHEVEKRIGQIQLLCGIAWIATLGLGLILIATGELLLAA
jgi:hypothetical protein